MQKKCLYMLMFTLLLIQFACERERYKGTYDELTQKEIKGQDFLQKQAIELTQKNIADKDVNERRAIRRRNREQESLNELNENSSKVKKKQENTGKFSFY